MNNLQQKQEPGSKFDLGKRRLDLVPVYPLCAWADVLTFGAAKYDARNWEKGMSWSRCYGAALRHILSWWDAEDLDPESGLHHLAHAICCLSFLLEYSCTKTGKDDRPNKIQKEEV